ncbi:15496_t:CDS:1 [Funneliformis mosseae]|uniref:15496_t:CDS:1 n=1 Tax=Funneliformis mosseae TaxID=27381 RepID=A0A9N9A9F9_FUNMO|nr:15496_t:CDS:1 [Funneliformis mosseae]
MKEQEKKIKRLEAKIEYQKEMIEQQGADIKQLVDYKNQINIYLLNNLLKNYNMNLIDYQQLTDLKTESNTTFHKNRQSIQEARKVLDEIVFPKDMEDLKSTLQKTLKVLEDSGIYK